MGQGIAIALHATGRAAVLLGRRPAPVLEGLRVVVDGWREAAHSADLLIIATPDDAIADAARLLLERGVVHGSHDVLHLSGLLDRSALAPLEHTGAALGSFHPLQTVADARTAPERFRGAWAGIEGDPRALAAGEGLAAQLGMRAVRLQAGAKPLYHAAATIVANYSVALAGVAERLARAAGVEADAAGRLYAPLLAGAAENLRSARPADALTGPLRRGDVGTVRRHLAALPPEVRALYSLLGLEALQLARDAGLEPSTADTLQRMLEVR
jgi:predicted short-subunit dehydrogenase-like oxidoreductase (DUF2520 family)